MDHERKKPDYILIAGLPRSGSTLLQSVLSNSAETFTLPETHFFEEAKKIHPEHVFSSKQVVELLALLQSKWQLCLDKLASQYRNHNHNLQHDIRDVYYDVIEQYRPSNQARTLVGIEKTPGNIIAIESLIEQQRSVKVILTCRNPVDFASSMIQQYWAPDSVSKISAIWNKVMRTITKLEARYPAIVKRIEYERMVQQPETTFSSAFDFSGLDYNNGMLSALNTNIDQFILPIEYAWKKNNVDFQTVKNPEKRNSLNIRQRLIVHRHSLYCAMKNGYLNLYKF